MTHRIDAILFDMGGTLRDSIKNDPSARQDSIQQIAQLTGTRTASGALDALLSQRARAYNLWARENVTELNERELWTRWMLPDHPAEIVGPLAVRLNQLWRAATGIRTVFPETKEVVLELFRRGYRLGLVSNTTSSVEVPHLLRELEITGCFDAVLLSCQTGTRKPDPAIMLEAAARMGVEPRQCAYIGNRFDRDLLAARNAGFARAVIISSSQGIESQRTEHPGILPDHQIENLRELLELFPARTEPQPDVHYQASLSTMWGRHSLPALADFMWASRRLGFEQVELNHQIDSSMLESMDLGSFPISSIHEPCPADISTEALKQRDWLISSPDDDCRRRGVDAIRRTVDLASRLHLPVMVVHCGMVSLDLAEEKKLRRLLEAGQARTPEYVTIQERMWRERAALIAPRLDSVKRSLMELLEYASSTGVRLGLENRYHFFDIPSPDEMEELLGLAGPSQLGFVYDVGHAQALDRLGFFPHEEWLRRFSSRMIEVHLHDVIGVNDHLAPGLGEVDFDMVARYLPVGAIRTLELQPSNTPEQVKAGLKHLARHGCIKII